MKLCETQWPTGPWITFSNSGTYEGIKYLDILYRWIRACSIRIRTRARARASFYCTKGWRTAAMPNEGWAAVIVGKLNFVPEGPSDEVCWQLENLRLTARARDTKRRNILGKIFPRSFFHFFFLYIFFKARPADAREFQYRSTIIWTCSWTYREAPIHDGISRSNADDVSRVWRIRSSSHSPCSGWTAIKNSASL